MGRGIHRELVDVGGKFVLAVEHLVVGDFLASVGGHAAHRGHEAGFDAAFHLVVGLVAADGFHQVVPLVLIRLLSRPDGLSTARARCVGLLAF